MKKYSYHPAADIFPLNDGPELDALAKDIKRNGLQHPIILHEGKILDGRRRYLACQRSGATATFLLWDGTGSPLDYVISSNIHRRHLTASQQSLVALRMLPLLKAEAKARQRLSKGRGKKGAQPIPTSFGKAAAQAARAVGCGTRTVEMAKKVADSRPDLVKKIEAGSMTIKEAHEEVAGKGTTCKEERLPPVPRRKGLCVASTPAGFKPDVKFLHGNALLSLRTLPMDSVDCCVTSVPYYLLRDYETEGQIGLEDSVDEWVANLVAVFTEVRRVLKSTGTAWINCGDTYAYGSGSFNFNNRKTNWTKRMSDARRTMNESRTVHPKSLIFAPHRLAIALAEDGWIGRAEIAIEKNNTDGCKDRPVRTHEYMYLFTKSDKYYFDADCLREEYSSRTKKRGYSTTPRIPRSADNDRTYELHPQGKLRGSVWKVGPSTGAGNHPAPMPLGLAVDCIRAGCPEGGVVLDPFVGSGTTAVAAVENRRHCVGIDLSRKYLGIAQKRVPCAEIISSLKKQKFCSGAA